MSPQIDTCYKPLRDDVIALYLAVMKRYQFALAASSIPTKAFTLLAQILAVSSNEVIKARFPILYYDPEGYIFDSICTFLSSFAKTAVAGVQKNLAVAATTMVRKATELLLLSSPAALSSKLLVLFLATLGSIPDPQNSTAQFLAQIMQKVGESNLELILIWVRNAIEFGFSQSGTPHVENAAHLIQSAANVLLCQREPAKEHEKFIVDLLKTALKSSTNFGLLTAVATGARGLSKDQAQTLLIRFENYVGTLLKIYGTRRKLDESSIDLLRNFRKQLVRLIEAKSATLPVKPQQMLPIPPPLQPAVIVPNEELTEIEEKLDDEGTLIPAAAAVPLQRVNKC